MKKYLIAALVWMIPALVFAQEAGATAAASTAMGFTTLLFILLPNILFGWWCSNIAKGKGHSGGNGFVGGFLFGLFGLIYWLIAHDKTINKYQQYQADLAHWQATQQNVKKINKQVDNNETNL